MIGELTSVTPRARERLIALARSCDVPVTVLRFAQDVADLLVRPTPTPALWPHFTTTVSPVEVDAPVVVLP